jgi:phosphatidylserine decarboxylase
MRFAPESLPIVAPFFGLALLTFVWAAIGRSGTATTLGVVCAVLGLALLMFFRDPLRHTPGGEGVVVSPADGRVIAAETLPDGRKHVVIFLSVFNVHVNRVPISGTVQGVIRVPGSYFHAGTPRAAGNARVDVEAQTAFGPVAWRQVSGAIARKISCLLKRGDTVKTGERFGLIYFGSRMDVFLPPSAILKTEPGLRVLAGESVIAEFPTKDR